MMYAYADVYNYEKLYMVTALLFAIILTVTLTVYTYCSLLRRERKIALVILQLIILLLQTAQFIAILSPPRELIFFTLIQGTFFCLLGPGFLLFSYTARYHTFPRVREWTAILALPLLGIIAVLLNGVHHQYFTIYNIFYIQYHKLYFLILIFNGIYALAGLFLVYGWQKQEETNLIRRFFFYIFVIIALLGAGIFQYLKPGLLHYSLVPAGIAIAQLFFTARNRDNPSSKSVLPARVRALDFIDEAVILTDSHQRIIYHNRAPFNRIIGAEAGKEIQALLKERVSLSEREFSFYDRGEQYDYTYYIQALGFGQPTGILYAFRDISKYKNLIRELDQKNHELRAVSEKLSEYTKVVRILTEEKERSQILEQIHCTVGTSIAQILKLIREIEMLDDSNILQIKDKIEESIRFAREGIRDIRQAVSTLSQINREIEVGYDD